MKNLSFPKKMQNFHNTNVIGSADSGAALHCFIADGFFALVFIHSTIFITNNANNEHVITNITQSIQENLSPINSSMTSSSSNVIHRAHVVIEGWEDPRLSHIRRKVTK